MRYRIKMKTADSALLPYSQNKMLTGAIYAILQSADPAYAAFLHSEGYTGDKPLKKHKLFTFSSLLSRNRHQDSGGNGIVLEAGELEWQVSSAMEEFDNNFMVGLMANGYIHVGEYVFEMLDIHEESDVNFRSGSAGFNCQTSIVTYEPNERGRRYLIPGNDNALISEFIRRNLISKHIAAYGTPPIDSRFYVEFDPQYVMSNRCTKMTQYGEQNIRGAYAPFRAQGSPEMLSIGYYAGFGASNSIGFGMVKSYSRY